MSGKHSIRVRSDRSFGSGQELLHILEDVLPVKFTNKPDDGVPCSGQLLFGDQPGEVETGRITDQVRLTVPRPNASETEAALVELNVRFADDADVPFPFRGRSVLSKAVKPESCLHCSGDEKVLASSDQGPIWVVSAGNGPKRFRSALALPAFPPDQILQDVLNGDRFIEILPLLNFLREVSDDRSFEGPPLRACFIFDDPNLHWPHYGFVNFQQIATHAEKENYHVSFATIPLDAWFTHGPTAQVFRNHNSRLSLCVHGNNHLREELARDYSRPARISLLRQAIRRIENLECRTGVQVCRVMVPPHGACTEEMLSELPGCGFEAACISHGSLHAYNKSKSWTRSLGFAASELIQGCPVLPRWGISCNATNTILLAAFLNQPMILRGHHQDLKGGIGLLDQSARVINSLGNVSWSNMTDLSRVNFRWRMDGSTCRLQPLGRKVIWQIPKGAARLIIENPFNCNWKGWQIIDVNGAATKVCPGDSISLTEAFNGAISIEAISGPPDSIGSTSISYGLTVQAILRRLLTEGRDRFLSLT